MPSKVITEELKEKIIDFYLDSPKSLSAVGKKFNLSNPTIIKILKDIPKYKKALIFNPNLDEEYFSIIDNEAKAYFLGLIITDGNVFIDEKNVDANRQASLSITLDLNDGYLLEKFKDEIKTNTNIAQDGRGCGQIAVRSNKIAEDLLKHGVGKRKTFTSYIPNTIPEDLLRHFIRGVFDGDGSIMAHKHGTRFLHSISFCGTHQLMSDISELFVKNGLVNIQPKVYDYKNKSLSEIKVQNKHDMEMVGDWMYKDATIYMKRKRNKYNFFKEFYGNSEVISEISKGSETP